MERITYFIKEKIMSKTFEDFSKDQNKETFKERLKVKAQNGKEWVVNNKELVIALTPFIFGSVTAITKVVGKQIKLGKEKELKELYCYDRSLGHYWRLRREVSNREWLEIDNRKSNGERLADILSEMKVLK